MRHWIKYCVVPLLFSTGLISSSSLYAVEVIANPTVDLTEISTSNLRRIFTMRNRQWHASLPIKVFVLPTDNKTHHQFCMRTLEVFPYQLEKIWGKLLFSGLGEPPVIVKNEAEMLERIRNVPGAIGYVEKLQDSEGILIISVGEK